MSIMTAINGEKAATALRNLSPAYVDSITELQTRGDEGWENIVTGLRDAVAEAYEDNRLPGIDEWDAIHEIADGQVPVYNRQRMDEVRIIGAAWSHETELDTTGADLLTIIGYVLYDVYRDAAYRLVEWVNENVDEDEEEVDEEDD
jgi:hypothetical protein